MTALLDADVLCYRAAAVAQDTVDWGDGDGPTQTTNEKMAYQVADQLVDDWTKAAKEKQNLLVFSDRTHRKASFRYHVCPTYKANRPQEKPPLHDEVYAYLKTQYPNVWIPGLEGDDVLGLMATGEQGNKYVVVSIDKDMLTVPCRQVNPSHAADGVKKVSLLQADYNWMFQTICGDSVDNFKGAPGAGKVRAAAALALKRSFKDRWEAVLDVFVEQHDKPSTNAKFTTDTAFDEALMNARCARILRYGDHDNKTGKVRLWHPDPDQATWIDPLLGDVNDIRATG